jgi:hypothetical protein
MLGGHISVVVGCGLVMRGMVWMVLLLAGGSSITGGGHATSLEALQNSWCGRRGLLLLDLLVEVVARPRIGHTDDRGMTLLLQLIRRLRRGAGVDHYPTGVVVRRVDRERRRWIGLRLQQAYVRLGLR